VLERVRWLLEQRIIRQVTPIFDTRALGYSSMLVAAKVDPQHPHRAAQVINEHPGVSHNYLRNHEFNLWFTIATEPDSELGLEGTLEVLAHEAGAESVRQLPTLRLFKIRMDLEMEGDTEALASSAQVRTKDQKLLSAVEITIYLQPPRELATRAKMLTWWPSEDRHVEFNRHHRAPPPRCQRSEKEDRRANRTLAPKLHR